MTQFDFMASTAPKPIAGISVWRLALSFVFLLFLPAHLLAQPGVVVSIAPVHSWVAQVSGDLWAPELLLPANADPHNASLRPSQRRAVAAADWLVWVGPELEVGLADLVQHRSAPAWQLTAPDSGLIRHRFRAAGRFHAPEPAPDDHEAHGHHEHEHQEHDRPDEHQGHAEAHHAPAQNHADHGHDPSLADGPGHHHDASTVDPHLWLDPENARRALTIIAERLGELDPANRSTYERNARTAIASLDARAAAWQEKLARVQGHPYLVFHDGYQYFDRAFDLAFAGAVTLNPEQLPGLATLRELRDAIKAEGIACLFAEAQYPDRLVRVLQEGSGLRLAYLDAQGLGLTPGPDHYTELMDRLVDGFAACQATGA